MPLGEPEMTAPDTDDRFEEIIHRAKRNAEKAYAPYSRFPVGAVIVTREGRLFDGCNVENASYGLAVCAERNAIFQMVAQGKKDVESVVVYTPTPTPTAPCGACRQVIHEFNPDAMVVCVCDGPGSLRRKLSDLLPDSFGPENIE
jgi:cytidine deaminase